MKRIIAIAMVSVMAIAMVACQGGKLESGNIENQQNQQVVEQTKEPEQPVEQTAAPVDVPDPAETAEPAANPDPEPDPSNTDVDYEHMFDFGGWEEGFAAAEDKDEFIENFWYEKTMNALMDEGMYELITTDEKAKQAFIDEFSAQMKLQMEEYMKAQGYEITDDIRALISNIVDEQAADLNNLFVPEQ